MDFIYSCSTDIALGVIDAIETLGLQGQVHTNGWGGAVRSSRRLPRVVSPSR
ncbi:MAG: hypothetical protein HPM95_18600 [Alphaproteobacteria bacterium]|nr:hypothetical protein [Alphaproteobacteria bacterium]